MNEIIVKDADEPAEIDIKSFWRLRVKAALDAVPEELLQLSEVDLIEKVKPTSVDWQLRHRFHELVENAIETGRETIYASALFSGICSEKAFYGWVLKKPERVALMMRPIGDEKLAAQEAYHYLMAKLKDFALNTKIDKDNIREMTGLAKFLADRGHGAVVQTINQKTLHAKVDLNKGTIAVSKEELKKQIQELESGSSQPPDIDVEAT